MPGMFGWVDFADADRRRMKELARTTAGAFGGGVASGVARALGAGRSEDAARLAGTALGIAVLLGLSWTVAMVLFGRTVYAGAPGRYDVLITTTGATRAHRIGTLVTRP